MVVAVLVGFGLLWEFRLVVFVLFVAIGLATAIRPMVDWLHARNIPRSFGIIFTYSLILTFIVGIAYLTVPLVISQVASISQDIPEYYTQFRATLLKSSSRVIQRFAFELPIRLDSPPPAPIQEEGQPNTISTVALTFSYVTTAGRGIFLTVSIFLLSFYWILESERTMRSFFLFLPPKKRELARDFYLEVETRVGGYLRGTLILSLTIGVVALFIYLSIGLQYALVLAIFAGLMEAVPLVGPALGAIPAILVAFSTDPPKALWVLLGTAIIQGLENYLLVPRIMNKSVGVNPFVTLLSLATLGSLLGLPGAIMAIPIAAIIQLLLNRLVITPAAEGNQTVEGRDYLSLLRLEARELTGDIRKQVRTKDETSSPQVDEIEDSLETIVLELDAILAAAESTGKTSRMENS